MKMKKKKIECEKHLSEMVAAISDKKINNIFLQICYVILEAWTSVLSGGLQKGKNADFGREIYLCIYLAECLQGQRYIEHKVHTCALYKTVIY